MFTKIAVLCAIVAAVSCGGLYTVPSSSGGGYGSSGLGGYRVVRPEQWAPAKYNFQYEVNDPNTGDIKSQKEQREGDNVVGQYSLVEPDGTLRVVDYNADAQNGFNARVTKQGTPVAAPAPAPAPIRIKPIYPSSSGSGWPGVWGGYGKRWY